MDISSITKLGTILAIRLNNKPLREASIYLDTVPNLFRTNLIYFEVIGSLYTIKKTTNQITFKNTSIVCPINISTNKHSPFAQTRNLHKSSTMQIKLPLSCVTPELNAPPPLPPQLKFISNDAVMFSCRRIFRCHVWLQTYFQMS